MSALTPIVDVPAPNYAAEQAQQPYTPPPVEEVEAVSPVRAVESDEDRVPSEEPLIPSVPPVTDAADISRAGMTHTEQEAADFLEGTGAYPGTVSQREVDAPALDGVRILNNRGVRELISGFPRYDNAEAQRRYAARLAMFLRYNAVVGASGENSAVASLRAGENTAYAGLGMTASSIAEAAEASRTRREEMAAAIERWLEGREVFTPDMLGFASEDGFRFSPLTDESRATLRAADVMASYDRNQIAAYLRETSTLTPNDFLFYDPTGLGQLALDERREFLAYVQRLLDEERIDARAAELQYELDQEEQLRVAEQDALDEQDRLALDRLRGDISSYYGQLLSSVKQYNAGIISGSLV